MNAQRLIMRARKQAGASVLVESLGRGLAAGLLVAVLVAAGWRLIGSPPAVWLIAVGPALLGIVAGLVHAVRRWPSLDAVAQRLDRELQLRGRLVSSLAIARTPTRYDAGFGQLVVMDADRRCEGLDTGSVGSLRPGHAWLVSALGIIALLVIELVPLRAAPSGPPAQSPRQTAAAAAPVDEAEFEEVTEARDAIDTHAGDDARIAEQLEVIDELAAQLERDGVTANERDEAAARLHDAAEAVASDAQRELEAADEVAERFDGLPEADDPLAEALRDALARGALDEAADRLDELATENAGADEAERRALADALRRLAEQSEAPSGSPASAGEPPSPDDPAASGDSTPDQPANPELDGVREALRQAADDIAPEPGEAGTGADADADADAESQRQPGAEQKPGQQEPGAQPGPEQKPAQQEPGAQPGAEQKPGQQEPGAQPGPEQKPGQQEPGAQPGPEQKPGQQEPGAQPGPEQKPGQQEPGAQPGPEQKPGQQEPGAQPGAEQKPGQQEPGAQPGPERKPGQQEPGAQPGPEQKPGQQEPGAQPGAEQKPGQQEPGAQPGPERKPGQQEPGAQPGPEQKPGQQEPGAQPGAEQKPGQQEPGAQPGPERKPGQQEPGAQPGPEQTPGQQTPGAQPGAQPGDRTDGTGVREARPSESADGTRKPSDVLRDAARRREDAAARRRAAERMQEAARRMIGDQGSDPGTGAGPELPDDPTAPAPFEAVTEDVPVEPGSGEGDLIGDWLDQSGTPDPTTFGAPTERTVRAARRTAERAVEDTSVPRRYHRLIRRYFERLPTSRATAPPGGTDGGS